MKAQQQKNLKKKLIEELAANHIVESACKKVGVSRATYYRWLSDDPNFDEAADEARAQGKERVNDLAESVVIKGIKAEDFRYVNLWLKHNHPHYVSKGRRLKRPFRRMFTPWNSDEQYHS